jgi:hypothetical protein
MIIFLIKFFNIKRLIGTIKEKKIIVPQNIDIHSSLDAVIEQINTLPKKKRVYLSFKRIVKLSPEALILLITLSKYMYEHTGEVVKWSQLSNEIYKYLMENKISDIDFIYVDNENISCHISSLIKTSKNILLFQNSEIKILNNPNQCGEAIDHTKNLINTWYSDEKIANKFIKQATDHIMAIVGNSLEHSECDGNGICYYSLQKYSYENQTYLKLVFGDTGMGIKNSLKNTHSQLIDRDNQVIKYAFKRGLSCREDKSGGLGFESIRETMKMYGGVITIRSGRAFLLFDSNTDAWKDLTFRNALPGTQTVFKLFSDAS